ncbi:MAG: hypothetical protein ACQEXQ_14735 [Bacillota bacterium]
MNCHYSDEEIYDVIDTITEHTETTLGNKADELWQFLNDLAFIGNTHGNSKGNIFGIGKTVMLYQLRTRRMFMVKMANGKRKSVVGEYCSCKT